MSSEIFDKNIGDLVKRGALKPDTARARERFLGAVVAPPERRSLTIAAAAAAVLVCATIIWSAKPGNRSAEPPQVLTQPEPPVLIAAKPAPLQGNDLLRGDLKLPSGEQRRPLCHFIGKSTLPDGLVFLVRVYGIREEFVGGRLQSNAVGMGSGNVVLEKGAFDYDSILTVPGLLRIDVSAPDDFQEREMVRTLTVKQNRRVWLFEYAAWDDKLRGLLGPQLAEVQALVIESVNLLRSCEAATATEEQFRAQVKQLGADAERLQVRVHNFAAKSVFPAALREIEYTLRNLGVLMQYFKWKDGKFQGPESYYGAGKGDLTHRNEAFSFAKLRGYLEDANRIGGREFGLWILKEFRRAGMNDALAAVVRAQDNNPFVLPFAGPLLSLTKDSADDVEITLRKSW